MGSENTENNMSVSVTVDWRKKMEEFYSKLWKFLQQVEIANEVAKNNNENNDIENEEKPMEEIKFLPSFPFNVHSRTSSFCNKQIEIEADKKPIVEEKSNDDKNRTDETIDESPVDNPLVEEPVKVAMEPEQTETEAV